MSATGRIFRPFFCAPIAPLPGGRSNAGIGCCYSGLGRARLNTGADTMPDVKEQNTKYAEFSHSFRDPWEGEDVELCFHFAKPTKPQIKRLQDTAGRNPTQAARNLLLEAVAPEEKEDLTAKMDAYPGIATSFSTALIKAVGISADLGN